MRLSELKVVLVSGNPGKLRELRALLPDWKIELLDTAGIEEETGETFYENARAKAIWGRGRVAGDAWVLGEDSGLEVRKLAGAPGVRSARFAGVEANDEQNVVKLLRELEQLDGEDRRARYVCELVLLSPRSTELHSRGTLEGTIARHPRGCTGFGYDPVFVPVHEASTVAVLGEDWKRAHSHRARAASALVEAFRALSLRE